MDIFKRTREMARADDALFSHAHFSQMMMMMIHYNDGADYLISRRSSRHTCSRTRHDASDCDAVKRFSPMLSPARYSIASVIYGLHTMG